MKKILLNRPIIKLIVTVLAISMLLPSCAISRDKSNIIPENVTSSSSESQPESLPMPPESTSKTDDVIIGVIRPSLGADGDKESSSETESSEPDTEQEEDITSSEETTSSEVTTEAETTEEETSVPEEPIASDTTEAEKAPEDTEKVEENDQPDVFVSYDVPLTVEQQMAVERIAEEYGIEAELVFGIMKVESKYNVNAVGKDGKYLGIMQVAISNLGELSRKAGVTDLMDFEQCVTAGCYFLKQYGKEADGDVSVTLLYYHGGYRYANNMLKKGKTQDSYTKAVIKELNRIVEARKVLASQMGATLTGVYYE